MAGGGGSSESGEPEFQIAPMVDVLLVLLIFFMAITSAEVLKVNKDIVLPVSPNAKKRDPELSKHELAINVSWDKTAAKAMVDVDDKKYPKLEDLIPYLKERKKSNDKIRAVVRGDRELPAIEIQRVMNIVGRVEFPTFHSPHPTNKSR
jgi:biopolymer transport protein ExbD